MSEMKHTPGPWKFDPAYATYGRYSRGEPAVIETPRGDIIIDQGVGRGHDEAKANARLIAAAPELYEALKAIFPDDGHNESDGCEDHRACLFARAALAKVEGREE